MQIDMTDEERDVLIRWKKRSDTYRLVRIKAEAIVYAARGVGLDIIAEMIERAGKTDLGVVELHDTSFVMADIAG